MDKHSRVLMMMTKTMAYWLCLYWEVIMKMKLACCFSMHERWVNSAAYNSKLMGRYQNVYMASGWMTILMNEKLINLMETFLLQRLKNIFLNKSICRQKRDKNVLSSILFIFYVVVVVAVVIIVVWISSCQQTKGNMFELEWSIFFSIEICHEKIVSWSINIQCLPEITHQSIQSWWNQIMFIETSAGYNRCRHKDHQHLMKNHIFLYFSFIYKYSR